MKDTVYFFIWNSHICRHEKTPKDLYNGLFKPLPKPTRSWTNVTLDFVIGFLYSYSYYLVLMVIDQLTKKKHYILYTTKKNDIITEANVYLLLNNV